MRITMLLCALLLSGCASFAETFEGWSRVDRTLYDSYTVLVVTDYLQTESALDAGYYEANPLFGKHPSDDRLAAITGVRLGAGYFLAATMPEKVRTEGFCIMLLPTAYAVIHNHMIGVRIDL